MRLTRAARRVPPARAKRDKVRAQAEQPAAQSADLADPFDLQRTVGNRATGNLLRGFGTSGHTSWAPEGAQAERKPEQMAEEEVERGPQKKPKTWAQDLKRAMQKTSPAQPIQITPVNDRQGVKLVSAAEFNKRAGEAKNFRQEAGLPRAFLDTSASIGPPKVSSLPSTDTNVTVQTSSAGNNKGKVWVQTAALPWLVTTAGYLDSSRIAAAMISDYQRHEEGHAVIAERIRDRLGPLLQAQLNKQLA